MNSRDQSDQAVEVLVLDHDPAVRTALFALGGTGKVVQCFEDATKLMARIHEGKGDVVVADAKATPGVAHFLREIRATRPKLPVILTVSSNIFHATIDAIHSGAFDCVPKPFNVAELTKLIDNAVAQAKRVERRSSSGQLRVVGSAPSLRRVYSALAKLTLNNEPVLFRGEIGVGKKHLGRALHDFSKRADEPFVVFSCLGEDGDKLELELFGGGPKNALYEAAMGGTLFIDEISRLSLTAQRRLANILARQKIDPDCDVRIMASTRFGLEEIVAEGSFDNSLYHFVNAFVVDVPPLRDRAEDIPDLLRYFGSLSGGPLSIDKETLTKLLSYRWPGNLQELNNFARRLAVFGEASELPTDLMAAAPPAAASTTGSASSPIEHSVEQFVRGEFQQAQPPRPGIYNRVMKQVEVALLETTLQYTENNKSRAAQVLGINRNTLRAKIEQYELE
jgi:two-component system, NtrC family, nitrogen regulation response regulator GlnG